MDYQKAASYWQEKEKDSVRMEPEALLKEIEAFIGSHNTLALATAGTDGFVRCTPVEYTYLEGCFWILSEGGLKFRGLESNPNAAAAIYDSYRGFGRLGGLQIMGTVSVIEPWSEDYLKLLAFKHLPEQQLRRLPSPMHLLCLKPASYDYLSSALKDKGFATRQHLEPAGR